MSVDSQDAELGEPSEPLEILVVDDDEVDRLAARHALESSGLAVRISEADGLRAARSAIAEAASAGIPFDCVLLDDFLGDGRARTLFEDSELPPVIVLTGSGNERVAVELMRAGASDYVPKDELTPSRIAQGIRHALEQRSSAHALRRANEELEQRVAERTAELARTNRRLEAQIEQRREAEERARHHLEQLAHAGRLSTLGEMAAGIAHELHQPLGAIVNFANGSLRRLEARPDDPKGLAGALGKIRDQAERAGEITRAARGRTPQGERRRRGLRLSARGARPDFRRLLFHQGTRHGHGAGDLPIDRRGLDDEAPALRAARRELAEDLAAIGPVRVFSLLALAGSATCACSTA